MNRFPGARHSKAHHPSARVDADLIVRLSHDQLHSLEMFAGIESPTPTQPRFVYPSSGNVMKG
jgi:hypothetical protein